MSRKKTFDIFKYEQTLKLESMNALARVQDSEISEEYIV
jgi:hypothetical protein